MAGVDCGRGIADDKRVEMVEYEDEIERVASAIEVIALHMLSSCLAFCLL